MKRYLIIFYILFVTSLTVSAQHPRGRMNFDPARFKADMEHYIAREACLTPKEASEFFPLFDEMLRKERALFDQMSNISRVKPATEKGCADAVKKRDELEIQIKEQNHFHRQMFKNRMGRGR